MTALLHLKTWIFLLIFWAQASQKPHTEPIVKAWAICTSEFKMDSFEIPLITHFNVLRQEDSLHVKFLNQRINQEEKEFFNEVCGCINSKYSKNFPDSTTIVHAFTKYNDRVSYPEYKSNIDTYIQSFQLDSNIVLIHSGTHRSH